MTTENLGARRPFYNTREWADLRERIVLRDGARCRNCGHPERLQVHHWLPEREFADTQDGTGYGVGSNPLMVHESGLIALCRDCHAALTAIRLDRSLKRDPREPTASQNVFQLWRLAGQQVPFKVVKDTWSGRAGQFMLVEEVEIKKWPYGTAWGRYCNGSDIGELMKVANAGTYTWAFYQHDQ